jgi:hypothetical protein
MTGAAPRRRLRDLGNAQPVTAFSKIFGVDLGRFERRP